MTKKFGLWFLTLTLLAVCSVLSMGGQLEVANYQPANAVQLAQVMDRQIIFIFVHPDCGYCTLYEEKTLSDSEVSDLIEKHFVLSMIDVDETFKLNMPTLGEITNKKLASALGKKGTPHTVFLYPPDPKYTVVAKLPGYMKTDQMVKILHFLGREIYKEDIKFSDYTVDEVGKEFYNYQTKIKEIPAEELSSLQEIGAGLEVVEETVRLKSLETYDEVILNFADKEAQKEFAHELISKGVVKKVFSVTKLPEEETQEK